MTWLGRFWSPLLIGAAIVATAPFIGQVMNWARTELGRERADSSVTWLLTVVLVVAFGLLLVRFVRSLDRDWKRRVALLGLGLVLFGIQIFGLDRGVALEQAMERIHLLVYGLFTFALYGALTREASKRGDPPGPAVVVATLAGVCIVACLDELLQWLVAVRAGDAWDVGVNLLAGAASVLVAMGWSKIEPVRQSARMDVLRALLWTPIAALLFAVLLEAVHLGHWVEASGVGRFRTLHTQERLAALNEDRIERWTGEMPKLAVHQTALDIEDHFLQEGAWHIQERNRAMAREDLDAAWREQSIVEEFYPSLLMVTIRGTEQLRFQLAPSQLAQLEAGKDAMRSEYDSPAAQRIWTWPPGWLVWTLTAVVLGSCGAALARLRD